MGQMKDSGVKWIGEVPEGWRILPVNYCFQEIVNLNTNLEENNALQFKMGEIISKKDGNSKYTPETLEGYNIVEPGDIMINGLNLSFDLISQRVAMVRNNGVITSTYLAIRPKDNTQSSYAQYLLKSYDNAKALHGMGRGLRATLTYNYFRREPFILPPLPEQERIAAYLDEKCGDIDRLVSIQEEMIEELKAYKQSLITEAVTKGLDPNAKLKPSGIEWIGEIPEGWEVIPVKRSGIFGNGLTYSPMNQCGEDGILVLRSSNIQNSKVVFDDNVYVNDAPEQLMVHKGDIIICSRNGSAALVGKCGVVEEDQPNITFGAFMMRYKPFYHSQYCFWCFQTTMTAYRSLLFTTTINQLTVGIISKMIMPLPPLQEQHAIASYLDTKTAEIDRLINLKQQKITELKDYKKSLIYECVTGKKEIV